MKKKCCNTNSKELYKKTIEVEFSNPGTVSFSANVSECCECGSITVKGKKNILEFAKKFDKAYTEQHNGFIKNNA